MFDLFFLSKKINKAQSGENIISKNIDTISKYSYKQNLETKYLPNTDEGDTNEESYET